MNTRLIIILGLSIILIIVFKYIEPIISKHKIRNNYEHGSARFASTEKIKKDFKKEQLNKIKQVGFPIYFDKKLNNVWMDKKLLIGYILDQLVLVNQ